ncbi:MAG: hypothetical protein K2Q10_08960, partial [Rhodospirillales bacterium]|nr:hypothetical protein [Rhodospirillales bacterium]
GGGRASVSGLVVEMSEGGCLLRPGSAEAIATIADGSRVEVTLEGIGRLSGLLAGRHANGLRVHFADGLGGADEAIRQHLAKAEASQRRITAIAGERKAMIEEALEQALARRHISIEDLFDTDYKAIRDTDPRQFTSRNLDLLERILPDIQEPVLSLDPSIVFCAAVDRNGYLPVHNAVFSKPQGSDPTWNNANCRNRRLFNDRTGLAAGRNVREHLVQTYPRDMGGGRVVMMKDVSSPIMVRGRHWGGLRIGCRLGG